VLQGSGIMPIVGKFVAAGVAQHVRVDRTWHLGGLAEPLKWKVPPLPGGQARRNKLLVSWGPVVIAAPLAG
jgi:hypothetical protein